jgi:membrane associated rhomboid family serine protease
MSWYRRSSGYNYNRPSFFGGFQFFPPVIKALLIANGAAFFGSMFLQGFRFGDIPMSYILSQFFFLHPLDGGFQIWQLFTYMFMHASMSHIFFNMLALWMFGMELENEMGSKKFFYFYMICGIGAGLCNLFIAPLFAAVGPTVGASGAVYGVLLAFGILFPERIVFMYFFPMPAKFMVGLYMLLEVYSGVTGTNDGIAHFAHLGGAAVGFIFLLFDSNNNEPTLFDRIKRKLSGPRYHGYNDGFVRYNVEDETPYRYHTEDEVDQERIDEILDKISNHGYEKLTEEEKRILFDASKKLN